MKYKLPALILTVFLVIALVPVAFADDGAEKTLSNYCTDRVNLQHPVGARIAERYEAEYATVMTWFCEDNFGFGEIMLAFETSKILAKIHDDSETLDKPDPLTPDQLLEMKSTQGGWGQVWKVLPGFNGRPKGDDWAGGPPEWAVPKDKDKDKDKECIASECAGPKDKDRKKPLPPTAGPKDK